MTCISKISRYLTGTPKRDTFVDGATYFAILGELALSPESTLKTEHLAKASLALLIRG